jgi:hypothetical protein
MARAQASQAERMAHESAVLLSSAHGKADEVAQKVSLIEGVLAGARQARDTVEVKLPGLVDKAVDIDERWEEAEG